MNTAKEQILWGLQQADVVKISDEEVEFLFGLSPEEGAKHIIEDIGVKLVFVTCGAKGCFFKNPLAQGWVEGLQGLSVVDTTGAGDIFGGSALWKLLQTQTQPHFLTETQLKEIARFATASAGLSTTKYGGIYSVPEYNEVLEKVKQWNI